MPNDAKFGLVVGLGLVVAVAVVFFQKGEATGATAALKNSSVSTPREQEGLRAAPATSRRPVRLSFQESERFHKVAGGDTLYKLARTYYGDGSRFVRIYEANRELISNPDSLPVGAMLQIP